jgi:hypothetical protein
MFCGVFEGSSIGFCTPTCFQGGWMQTAGSSTQGDGTTVAPQPDATANTVCTTGYQGPAGGQPQCVLFFAPPVPDPTAPPTMVDYGCAIICTTQAQCPGGLSCDQVQPNPPVSICK